VPPPHFNDHLPLGAQSFDPEQLTAEAFRGAFCQRLPRSIKAVPMGDAQIDTPGGPHLPELEVTKRNQVREWGPP
jgi:hypothetical protein